MVLISRLGSSGPIASTSVNKSDNGENCAERPHANELLGCSKFRSATKSGTLLSSHASYKVLIVGVNTTETPDWSGVRRAGCTQKQSCLGSKTIAQSLILNERLQELDRGVGAGSCRTLAKGFARPIVELIQWVFPCKHTCQILQCWHVQEGESPIYQAL